MNSGINLINYWKIKRLKNVVKFLEYSKEECLMKDEAFSKNQSSTPPVSLNNSTATNSLPKLTVEQIVKKFVNPSSHRKIIQLSEHDKTNNK
jgi:hypothetical protein